MTPLKKGSVSDLRHDYSGPLIHLSLWKEDHFATNRGFILLTRRSFVFIGQRLEISPESRLEGCVSAQKQ